ncbi:MAG: hypothetical protein NTZ32_27180 [Planctomycetales bacterium]|nr:hypothetical protein [Planctomycetales bacterium]
MATNRFGSRRAAERRQHRLQPRQAQQRRSGAAQKVTTAQGVAR